jgi:hypothetical protein
MNNEQSYINQDQKMAVDDADVQFVRKQLETIDTNALNDNMNNILCAAEKWNCLDVGVRVTADCTALLMNLVSCNVPSHQEYNAVMLLLVHGASVDMYMRLKFMGRLIVIGHNSAIIQCFNNDPTGWDKTPCQLLGVSSRRNPALCRLLMQCPAYMSTVPFVNLVLTAERCGNYSIIGAWAECIGSVAQHIRDSSSILFEPKVVNNKALLLEVLQFWPEHSLEIDIVEFIKRNHVNAGDSTTAKLYHHLDRACMVQALEFFPGNMRKLPASPHEQVAKTYSSAAGAMKPKKKTGKAVTFTE